jgi:hypothetical protein
MWSGVHETFSVDVAVTSLSAAAQDTTEQTNLLGYNSKSKFPPWFYLMVLPC